MAFLSNEQKFFWAKNLPSTEHISPGFYIPQTIRRNMKKNFVPFGSNVEKKPKVEFSNVPLNHSNNIYLINSDKYQFFHGKKRNRERFWFSICKRILEYNFLLS